MYLLYTMSYQLISLVFYNLILLFLLFVWIKTKGWQLNGTLYILFFLLFSGIISAFYWNVSNGTIRNYSNLTPNSIFLFNHWLSYNLNAYSKI